MSTIKLSDLLNNTYIGAQGFTGSQGIDGSGVDGGGSDKVFYLNDQVVTTNYTIPSDQNALTTGPIDINPGVVVTVSTGARWVVI